MNDGPGTDVGLALGWSRKATPGRVCASVEEGTHKSGISARMAKAGTFARQIEIQFPPFYFCKIVVKICSASITSAFGFHMLELSAYVR